MGTTLDKPVKTYLVASIKDALQSVTALNSDQIKYGQGIPTDQDTAVYPWTCFFDEPETKDLIDFRLKHSGFDAQLKLFTDEAVSEIQRYSQGYPRRINLICHNALRSLIIGNKTIIDGALIRDLVARSVV